MVNDPHRGRVARIIHDRNAGALSGKDADRQIKTLILIAALFASSVAVAAPAPVQHKDYNFCQNGSSGHDCWPPA